MPTVKKDLKQGMKGKEIIELQNFLKKHNVYKGKITGFFGQLTSYAVRSFQKQYGLKQTGVIDATTREKFTVAESIVEQKKIVDSVKKTVDESFQSLQISATAQNAQAKKRSQEKLIASLEQSLKILKERLK